MAKPRLTWKKTPRSTGLARVCEGELGYDLRMDGRRIGGAHPHFKGGYYWAVIGTETIKHRNTAHVTVATIEEAKTQCMAYVRECLAKGGEGAK